MCSIHTRSSKKKNVISDGFINNIFAIAKGYIKTEGLIYFKYLCMMLSHLAIRKALLSLSPMGGRHISKTLLKYWLE